MDEETRQIVSGGQGLSVLNWNQNFQQVRWVQVFWKPGEVTTYAALSGLQDAVGRPISNAVTEDQGNVQLTRTADVQNVVVTGEDGRACRLTVAPNKPEATCPPTP